MIPPQKIVVDLLCCLPYNDDVSKQCCLQTDDNTRRQQLQAFA